MFDRKAILNASPMLADFVSCALQDLGLSEQDEAFTDERDARDSGTIYRLQDETFDALRLIASRFERECGELIDAALALDPKGVGFEYARKPMSLERIGSTLWLAVTGSGVTFTDDGNAACLEQMATWARANSVESLYFGDDGEVYLS